MATTRTALVVLSSPTTRSKRHGTDQYRECCGSGSSTGSPPLRAAIRYVGATQQASLAPLGRPPPLAGNLTPGYTPALACLSARSAWGPFRKRPTMTFSNSVQLECVVYYCV
ncbi:uncharacterized protein HMPREF1120_06592 [Exophiala dermatitidis NIH/UT8656]|uniref:Uncharacterized protein n=1 Tax=Exophiala dermatitidis (strain ATCC 34100 / CBS 525.76 / NIH/UT8656) TaxID=858893 RepID=H6C1J4_EXODN|nr:uncharacterized protein HMPREF1120_06592 [Exophiala dermatitidis NIH/UT8656]EHY58584.1 hypothetical protein HMPREF1120_06592 [Exophiala dermatitidis NIH/UT8656]